jgi:hypothetical protein
MKFTTAIIVITLISIISCAKNDEINPIKTEETIITQFNTPLILSTVSDKKVIDLDKDGINDILFSIRVSNDNNNSTLYFYCAEPMREAVEIVNTGHHFANSYPKNSTISENHTNDPTMRWTSSLGVLLEKAVFDYKIERIGMFNGSQQLHLGVRIKNEQNTYFGWVEISHQTESAIDRISIIKTGINKIPGKSIVAGK